MNLSNEDLIWFEFTQTQTYDALLTSRELYIKDFHDNAKDYHKEHCKFMIEKLNKVINFREKNNLKKQKDFKNFIKEQKRN